MKKVLVLGASGATGKLVVRQFVDAGCSVIAVVRSVDRLPRDLAETNAVDTLVTEIDQLTVEQLSMHLIECDAVVSCLGHNLSFKGIYGHPRFLVKQAIEKTIVAIEGIKPEKAVKIILMNSTGNANRDILERPPFSQRLIVFILRWLLPPHRDNEKAADALRLNVGSNHPYIEWCAVRPDTLIDETVVSNYELFESPTRNAIFDAGDSSRINVANLMKRLVLEDDTWEVWKGKMPVMYNNLTN